MKRLGTALTLALLSGCYSSPSKFWVSACQNETGERRYETPEPEGLVVLNPWANQLAVLVLTGADWIEHDAVYVGAELATVYTEDIGRYRIRLAKLADPICREALRNEGFDPDTRNWVGRKGRTALHYAESVCLEAKRLGDVVRSEVDQSSMDAFKGYSAPYGLRTISNIDPRSPVDDKVYREVTEVVEIATGKPIIELTEFGYSPKTNWFPSIRICGAPQGGYPSQHPIPTHVFRPQP